MPKASFMPATDTNTLEQRLSYEFVDKSLLATALTHTSWCADNNGGISNQRLEFLGDAVLGLSVAHWLYTEYNDLPEGQMSKARAEVVNKEALATVARNCCLGDYLLVSQGEEAYGGRDNSSLLADALESIIGAVYLDGGLAAADAVIRHLLDKGLKTVAQAPGYTDFKSRLQETAAIVGVDPPQYVITDSGPPHNKRFQAVVSVGETTGVGQGYTKKSASQCAAEIAYKKLSGRKQNTEGNQNK